MSTKPKNIVFQSDSIFKKYEKLRAITKDYFYITKQYIGEVIGTNHRTTRDDLFEKMIEALKESQARHKLLLYSIRDTLKSFENLASSQEGFYGVLSDLIITELSTNDQLRAELSNCALLIKDNSEASKSICIVLETIIDKIKTLCERAIQDTVETAEEVKISRIRLDSLISQSLNKNINSPIGSQLRNDFEGKIDDAKQSYEQKKAEYFIKQKYLEFNRSATLISSFTLLHKSMRLYYSGANSEIAQSLLEYKKCPITSRRNSQ